MKSFTLDLENYKNELIMFKANHKRLIVLLKYLRNNKKNKIVYLENNSKYYKLNIKLQENNIFLIEISLIEKNIYQYIIFNQKDQLLEYVNNFEKFDSYTLYKYEDKEVKPIFNKGIDNKLYCRNCYRYITEKIKTNNFLNIDTKFCYQNYEIEIITYFSNNLDIYFFTKVSEISSKRESILRKSSTSQSYFPIHSQIGLIFFILNKADYQIIDASNFGSKFFGYKKRELLNTDFKRLIKNQECDFSNNKIENVTCITKDKQLKYMDVIVEEIDYYGQQVLILFGFDISDIVARKDILQFERDVYYTLMEESSNGAIIINNQGLIKVLNQGAKNILKVDDTIINQDFNNALKIKCGKNGKFLTLDDLINLKSTSIQDNDHLNILVNKTWIKVSFNITKIYRNNQDRGYILVFDDITRSLRHIERLKDFSYKDSMTMLYNRRYLKDYFKQLNKSHNSLGLMLIDGNNLKLINDAYGHNDGDYFIKLIGTVLKKIFKDKAIATRWGGDEFLVLIKDTTLEQMENYSKNISIELKKLNQKPYNLSVSVGYILQKNKKENLDTMVTRAEKKMYLIKFNQRLDISDEKLILKEYIKENHEIMEHSNKVMILSYMVGNILKLNSKQLYNLRQLSFVHDIGKLAIDQSIINKPDKLNKAEWKIIKKHPKIGYDILIENKIDEYLAQLVLMHHERWDGKGYPNGISKTDILIEARVVSVCDAFDAMVSKRVYKESLSIKEAKLELANNANSQFDPLVVDAFLSIPDSILYTLIN